MHFFDNAPIFFCQFINNDHSIFSEILATKTETKLRKIQIQNCFKFIKHYLNQNLPKLDFNDLILVIN